MELSEDTQAAPAAMPSIRSNRPGFTPDPDVAAPAGAGPHADARSLVPPSPEAVRAAIEPEFEPEYYRATYADVRESGMAPLDHFLMHGAAELRDPARWFDMRFYVLSNEDVLSTGHNGFWHYLVQGRAQGRAVRRAREPDRQALLQAKPPAEREWNGAPPAVACLLPRSVRQALQARLQSAPGVHVCISHDRYTSSVGGVQILVADEQAAFNAQGDAYLHVAPVAPRLRLAPDDEHPFYVHLTLDGAYAGVSTYADLAAALQELRPGLPGRRQLILHCVLGHQVTGLIRLHAALAPSRSVFWVNDYESICDGYNLLRNDVAFCGAPPPGSFACRICVYGRERPAHLARFQALFAAVPMHVVCPSAATLAVWQAGAGLPHLSAQVHEYAEVQASALRTGQPGAAPRGTEGNPVRVAFVGYDAVHKGWPAFVEVAAQLSGVPAYRLFHLAATPPAAPARGVEVVPARVTPRHRGAMTELLAAHEIDLVLVLSPWPETFCLVAYEALAAGADVVTLPDSGNVASMVLRTGRGVVARDVPAVIRFFLSGAAVRYVQACGAAGSETGRLVSRGMTATLPDAAAAAAAEADGGVGAAPAKPARRRPARSQAAVEVP